MYTRQNLTASLVLAISMVGISYGAGGDMGAGTEPLTDGSAAYPYLIEDPADFDVFADPCNSATYWASGVHTKLTCDPNLAGRPYATAVIAPDTSTSRGFQGTAFAGVFDGNDHIVSNLTIDTAGTDNDYLGLFGYISDSSAKVKNFGLENVNITGGIYSNYLGGLCGYKNHGTISNCYATGSVTGDDYLGGLCGYNGYGGTITNCYATGSVTGGNYLGGLCGYNGDTITNCYATGSVTGGNYLGGLCGYNGDTITNCYATGSVTGGGYLGGLCGSNSNPGTITNCYATGSVTGGGYLGGLCGYNYHGTITNCYATGLVTGGADSEHFGGLCGRNYYGTITNCYFHLFSGPDNSFGTALDDLQMQDAASFAGFDFAGNPNDGEDDYWTIVSGHCPKLIWQTDDGPLVPSPPVTTLLGSGYSYNPFQITSYADFTEFRTNSSLRYGYYILVTDIDLSGETFTTAVIDGVFGGHFDGNGHIISDLTIDTAGASNGYLGLFGKISASVSNLAIENINIAGGVDSYCLGGLCGKNDDGTITNCYATGSVTGGDNSRYLGGLCGLNDDGTISNCYATASVTGDDSLGGLCGENRDGTISNCYATGSVTGGDNSRYLGGLCGLNDDGTISNCYAAGSVTGGGCLGGLCGENNDGTITNCYAAGSVTGGGRLGGLCGKNNDGTITNCYATGSVTGDYYFGGLCGYNGDGTTTNCFWDVETSGTTDGVGNQDPDPAGVIGKTTEQMQTESTFTDANWDFSVMPVWRMPFQAIGYPMLGWQKDIPGDFTGRYGVYMDDFAVLSNAWLSDNSPTANWNEHCDLNGNGVIDPGDLKTFAEHWLCK